MSTTMEYECSRIAPLGVSIHSSRIAHTNTPSMWKLLQLAEIHDQVSGAGRLLN